MSFFKCPNLAFACFCHELITTLGVICDVEWMVCSCLTRILATLNHKCVRFAPDNMDLWDE